MTETKKAIRAEIKLGEIPLEVFMLPDGSYRLSQTQVGQAVKLSKQWYSNIKRNNAKALQGMGFNGTQIEISTEAGKAKTLTIEDSVIAWTHFAMNGSTEALSLIAASAIESIERRADAVFNVKREEEERQQLFEVRRKRIEARHSWTGVIKEKQIDGGYYRTEKGNKEFADLTVEANQVLFGVRDFAGDRDNMTLEQQMIIQAFEIFLKRQHTKHKSMSASALVSKALREF